MNERGTYGPQVRNSYDLQVRDMRPPILGLDAEVPRAAMNLGATLLFTILGGVFGAKVTPKDPNKGSIIGSAAGFALSLMGQQTGALCRIASRPS